MAGELIVIGRGIAIGRLGGAGVQYHGSIQQRSHCGGRLSVSEHAALLENFEPPASCANAPAGMARPVRITLAAKRMRMVMAVFFTSEKGINRGRRRRLGAYAEDEAD
jgi:hypothetical protein